MNGRDCCSEKTPVREIFERHNGDLVAWKKILMGKMIQDRKKRNAF
jgi:hypothetical protein